MITGYTPTQGASGGAGSTDPLKWLAPTYAGVSTAAGIAQGIAALVSHNKLADLIEGQDKTIPQSLFQAEDVLKELAFQGLPGFEGILDELKASMPTNLNQLKELAVSPSGLLGAASQMQFGLDKNIRSALIENAATKTQNKQNLANFYAKAMAPAEMRVEDWDIQKNIMAQEEKFAGVSELFQGIGGGISGGIEAFGSGKMIELLGGENFIKYLQSFNQG